MLGDSFGLSIGTAKLETRAQLLSGRLEKTISEILRL
jgi:hypothetical protein